METLFDIFLEYGWLGILGVFIGVLILIGGKYAIYKITNDTKDGFEEISKNLTHDITESNKDLINSISEQNKDITKQLLYQQQILINHFINNKENHDKMVTAKTTGELAEEINKSLEHIREIHGARRAFILQFHNSQENLSGTPFVHYSCSYEKIDKGMHPIQNACQVLPFSAVSYITKHMQHSKNQQVMYSMEEIENECPSFYELFKIDDAGYILFTAMYDKNNKLIGMLCLEFNEKPKINLNKLHIQEAEITQMVNLRYKYVK